MAINPILHLAKLAEIVSSRGDYSLRAPASGKDEVETLTRSFNNMLRGIQERDNALQSAKDELETRVQTRTEALQREVIERVRAEETLSKERQALRALIDHVPDFMYIEDTGSRFIVANAAVARSMGVKSPEELLCDHIASRRALLATPATPGVPSTPSGSAPDSSSSPL